MHWSNLQRLAKVHYHLIENTRWPKFLVQQDRQDLGRSSVGKNPVMFSTDPMTYISLFDQQNKRVMNRLTLYYGSLLEHNRWGFRIYKYITMTVV